MYRPVKDYVIAEQVKESMYGSIIIAESDRKANRTAVVLATGKDVEELKQGDVILFDRSAGSILEDTAEHVIIALPEGDVITRIEEEK